jgi:hypothetical protein
MRSWLVVGTHRIKSPQARTASTLSVASATLAAWLAGGTVCAQVAPPQTTTGQSTTGQATTGQATTGQATTGQSTTGQATAVAAPLDPREREARAAFEAGVAALTDERYADALTHFEQSYQIRRAASVALNLGITLRALGRLVEARSRLNEFLELANPAQHDRHDREVATFIADISRRVGRVRITALEPASARLLIDGRRAVVDERDEVAIDPGEHRIEGVLAGYETALETVRVETGGRAEVSLRLRVRRATDPRVTLTTTPSGGVLQSPVFWVSVAVGVAAAVAIPTVIVLTSGPDIPRLPGLFCVRTDRQDCPVGGGT